MRRDVTKSARGKGSFGRHVMLQRVQGEIVGGERSDFIDSERGNGVVLERRDVTDSGRCKEVGVERRDVTDSARGSGR